MGLSKEERMELAQKRRSLRKEIRFLETMPKDTKILGEREKALKAEIQEINKKLAD